MSEAIRWMSSSSSDRLLDLAGAGTWRSVNRFEFYGIVERFHTIQNPTSAAKLDQMIEYCGISDGQKILDIGCGKGWLLHRLAEKHSIQGVGVDRHPGFIEVARHRHSEHLTFHELDARSFADGIGSFDVAMCIGASFAIGTFEELVPWLRRFVKPGGVMVVGDIYAKTYELTEQSARHFSGGKLRSFAETCDALNSDGLRLVGLLDSSADDWDRYESMHWSAAEAWLDENPEHPDREAFLRLSENEKMDHIRFDRDALGWALFVCRLA